MDDTRGAGSTSCCLCDGLTEVAYFMDPRRGWIGVSLLDFDYRIKQRREELERLRTNPPPLRLSEDTLVTVTFNGQTVSGTIDGGSTLRLSPDLRTLYARALIESAGYDHYDEAVTLDEADLKKHGPRNQFNGHPESTGERTIAIKVWTP